MPHVVLSLGIWVYSLVGKTSEETGSVRSMEDGNKLSVGGWEAFPREVG